MEQKPSLEKSPEELRFLHVKNFLYSLAEKKTTLTDFRPVAVFLGEDNMKVGWTIVEFKKDDTADLIDSLKSNKVVNVSQDQIFMLEDFIKASASALIKYPFKSN